MTSKADLYRGEKGKAYYAQRAAYRAPEHQRRRGLHFTDVVTPQSTVLDFGCGNGGVLASLKVGKRIGIEIGTEASAEASECLDEVHDSVSKVQPATVDLAISYHALEHATDPFRELLGIYAALKPRAKFRFIVPFDGHIFSRWHKLDKTMHLYAWTPLTFGNLLTVAGFEVHDCALAPQTMSERLPLKSLMWLKALAARRFQVIASGIKP